MATGRVPTTANSPLTAKGDLFGYSTTQARVPVGNNGDTLLADSSTSTGLRWQGSQTAGKNALINGAFDIWQRGTSINGSAFSYGADRWAFWRFNSGTGLTASQGSGLTGSQYTLKVQRNAGQTFTDKIYVSYDMETADSYRFAGKTVTFSFYVRKGANYSGGDISVGIGSGTGTNQNQFNGYTGGTTVASTTATISSTSTFQRVTVTGTVSSSATQVGVYINYTPSGTAGAADFIEIGQAQLELGSVATDFLRAGGTLQGELAACQRYYQHLLTGTKAIGIGHYYSSTAAGAYAYLTVEMRTTPTLSATSGTNYYAIYTTTGDPFDSLTLGGDSTSRLVFLYNNSQVSGTAGSAGEVYGNSASASVGVSAEL